MGRQHLPDFVDREYVAAFRMFDFGRVGSRHRIAVVEAVVLVIDSNDGYRMASLVVYGS